MKRARGKNPHTYDEIDVPEMLKGRTVQQKNASVKKKKSKKKKKKNNILKSILVIIFALLAAFLIAMGMGWGSNGDDEGALIPVDMDKGKLNVLVLGVDKGGLRTDAMMLVSYDLKNPSAKLMSIPRDTQIKVADRKVTRKINEIHAMHDSDNNLLGPLGSVRAVTALTSVPIHYYIEFSFDAIDEITDVIGPIEFDVPDVEGNGQGMNYDDPAQDLHIHLKPGLQMLEGNEVQQFLRYRKSNSGTGDGSDISRVERQQEFIKAIVDQKVNLSLIAKVPRIYSKMKKHIKTNFSAGDAVKYAKYLNGFTKEGIETFNLPGASKIKGGGWYFVCDLDKTAELVENTFGYEARELTNVINVNDVTGTKDVLTSDKKSNSKKESNNSDAVQIQEKENDIIEKDKTEYKPQKEDKAEEPEISEEIPEPMDDINPEDAYTVEESEEEIPPQIDDEYAENDYAEEENDGVITLE